MCNNNSWLWIILIGLILIFCIGNGNNSIFDFGCGHDNSSWVSFLIAIAVFFLLENFCSFC